MTIYIAGGGDWEEIRKLDEIYVGSLKADPKVLYVPLAMDPPYAGCLEWFRSVYEDIYGILDITMLESFDSADEAYVNRFDSIFIGGGNTFELMMRMDDAGFSDILRNFLRLRGKSVYGGSAGAIILGKSIMPASLSDTNPGLQDLAGLDLLGGSSVACHYEAGTEPQIQSMESEIGPIIRLTEEEGAIFDGATLRIIR